MVRFSHLEQTASVSKSANWHNEVEQCPRLEKSTVFSQIALYKPYDIAGKTVFSQVQKQGPFQIVRRALTVVLYNTY